MFEPTREAALERLAAFVPKAGRTYAAERNFDRGAGHHTGVSTLSPYTRHRLLLEREIVDTVLKRWSLSTADKFVSEVYWRSYFKGYLERHPGLWPAYQAGLAAARSDLTKDGALRAQFDSAVRGDTGIDAFDHWAQELIDTGYLHNHARMWFASIWIFTLRLPWELGADFFLRHLLDGDPASNTLSWRWVGGLHTRGKTYLARPDNIAKFTEGRFRPTDLAPFGQPLLEDEPMPTRPAPQGDAPPDGPALWLLTEEDCADDTLPGVDCAGLLATDSTASRSDRPVAEHVARFAHQAVAHSARRRAQMVGAPLADEERVGPLTPERVRDAARACGTTAVATHYVPVGPAQDAFWKTRAVLEPEGFTFHALMRADDARTWAHADKGFFKVKKAIPKLLTAA